MNYFITMHCNLLLNTELNKITLQPSNKAWCHGVNDFGKLPKWIKTFLKTQSDQDQSFIRRFSVMNYELVFIRVCKLPTAYDIDSFICFQNQPKCKGYCKLSCKSSVTAKFICNTLISYNLAWKFMQYLTQVWIIMSIKYLIFLIFLCFRAYMSCFWK